MVDQLADALRPHRQICHLEQEPPLQLSQAQLDCSSAAVRTEHHLGRLDGFLPVVAHSSSRIKPLPALSASL